jgi:hypothetical protein
VITGLEKGLKEIENTASMEPFHSSVLTPYSCLLSEGDDQTLPLGLLFNLLKETPVRVQVPGSSRYRK